VVVINGDVAKLVEDDYPVMMVEAQRPALARPELALAGLNA
jgi:hypothetical protein